MAEVALYGGAFGVFKSTDGSQIKTSLVANPSHLEAVDPVVEGRARAKQDHTRLPRPESWGKVLPVILHGDAAFAGQGIVAETLNLQALDGYQVGGTLHLIQNNQVGFTTDPEDARSTPYAADMAKGFNVPIVHVNADDPEAVVFAARLAADEVDVLLVSHGHFDHIADAAALAAGLIAKAAYYYRAAGERSAERAGLVIRTSCCSCGVSGRTVALGGGGLGIVGFVATVITIRRLYECR